MWNIGFYGNYIFKFWKLIRKFFELLRKFWNLFWFNPIAVHVRLVRFLSSSRANGTNHLFVFMYRQICHWYGSCIAQSAAHWALIHSLIDNRCLNFSSFIHQIIPTELRICPVSKLNKLLFTTPSKANGLFPSQEKRTFAGDSIRWFLVAFLLVNRASVFGDSRNLCIR